MTSSAIDSATERLIHEIATQCQEAGTAGAAFGIVRGQELIWTHGYGYSDLDSDGAPNENTLFRIASITKTFTALAIFQLRDKGLLSVDDPLTTHLPEFSAAKARRGRLEDVTLRRIMCHHSGLTSYSPTGDPYWSTLNFPDMQTIIAALPETEIVIEPDSIGKYSNLGFGILGEVISRVSGVPYEEYIAAQILDPLDMASTTFEPEGDLRGRLAVGYEADPYSAENIAAPLPNLGGQVAAGQLYSTVADLARWVSFQFSTDKDHDEYEPILSARSLSEMQRPQFLESGWKSGYCLPWGARRNGDDVFLGHSGGLPGYKTSVGFNIERELGVIMLCIGDAPPDLPPRMFDIAIEVLSDVEESAPPRKQPSVPEEYREYLGIYSRVGTSMTIRIDYTDGALRASLFVTDRPGLPPVHLDPTDERDIFRGKDGRLAGDPARFMRAADGSVNGFTIEATLMRKLVVSPD